MKTMTPTEVCERLGIQPSTLRKYSLLFEKEQIVYERNRNQSRNYTVMQVEAMEEALRQAHNNDITLEEAIREASKRLKSEGVITPKETITGIAPQRHNADITAVMLQEIAELKEQIRQQDEVAEKRDKERRDRELLFVEAMEKMQNDMNKLLERLPEPTSEPTSVEEEKDTLESQPQAEPEQKKGFLARLFKK